MTTRRREILRSLLQTPGSGLDLMGRFRNDTTMRLHQGNTYPLLRSMEREGLLSVQEVPGGPERGGRPRIVYSVTHAGKAALGG